MDNYSPELERAQLLEEFKLADAKFNNLTGERNDARLERAKWLLAIRNTFPIEKYIGSSPVRAGWKDWCLKNLSLTFHNVALEISFAIDPQKLTIRRERSKNSNDRPSAYFVEAFSRLKKGWPNWTDEQRQKIIDRVVELANAA